MSTAVGESFAATAPPALSSKSIGSSSRPPRRAAQFHERRSSMSGPLLRTEHRRYHRWPPRRPKMPERFTTWRSRVLDHSRFNLLMAGAKRLGFLLEDSES